MNFPATGEVKRARNHSQISSLIRKYHHQNGAVAAARKDLSDELYQLQLKPSSNETAESPIPTDLVLKGRDLIKSYIGTDCRHIFSNFVINNEIPSKVFKVEKEIEKLEEDITRTFDCIIEMHPFNARSALEKMVFICSFLLFNDDYDADYFLQNLLESLQIVISDLGLELGMVDSDMKSNDCFETDCEALPKSA